MGRGGDESMLLDSIRMCVAYLTSIFGSFTRSIAKYGYNRKGWMGKQPMKVRKEKGIKNGKIINLEEKLEENKLVVKQPRERDEKRYEGGQNRKN